MRRYQRLATRAAARRLISRSPSPITEFQWSRSDAHLNPRFPRPDLACAPSLQAAVDFATKGGDWHSHHSFRTLRTVRPTPSAAASVLLLGNYRATIVLARALAESGH